jgi:hypothetical protein
MINLNLCPPAIIYLFFSLTQITIDMWKGLYNTAIAKVIIMLFVTTLLNVLCILGFGVVSWIIVFIPFILMSVIVSVILYVFGFNASTGKINYGNNNVSTDASGNIIIYDPDYNPTTNPVYYNPPNIVVPNPNAPVPITNVFVSNQPAQPVPPSYWYSSDPAYQS